MAANDFARNLGIRVGRHLYLEDASPGLAGRADNKTLSLDDVEYGIRFLLRRELR